MTPKTPLNKGTEKDNDTGGNDAVIATDSSEESGEEGDNSNNTNKA